MNPGLIVMNVRRLMKRFNRQKPYRGALIRGRFWYFERVVLAFLWAGVSLCGYLAGQQIYNFYEDGQAYQSNPAQKSLPKLNASIVPLQPSNALPVVQHIKADGGQSLFRFKQAETKTLPNEGPPPEDKHTSKKVTEQIKPNPHIWQLEVKRLHEMNMAQQLANAKYQLQSGYFDLARQSFEQILQHDPHHVVALAGMLVVISQRGDLYQREDYLRRLRQEIPDYVPDDDLFLLQVAD